MNWPAYSLDLNPIENFWSMLKQKVYKNGCQFTSKDVLWSAIVDVCCSFISEGDPEFNWLRGQSTFTSYFKERLISSKRLTDLLYFFFVFCVTLLFAFF